MHRMNSNSQVTSGLPASDPETGGASRPGVQVRILSKADLDPTAIAAWNDLEKNAVSSTPYLSRLFLEPATSTYFGQREPVYVIIEREDQWIGVGVFEAVSATRAMPLPHLRAWRTKHTYLDGMLIRQGNEQEALQAFWEFMQNEIHPWYAVEFKQLAEDDLTTKYLGQSAAAAGVDIQKGSSIQRASVEVSSQQASGISIRRARSLRKGWNWLSRQGDVSFRIQNNQKHLKRSAERFLELEAMGWKSLAGTALASEQTQRRFFLELVDRFSQQDRIFFLELTVDDLVIASVVHFVAGDISYAFKLGWNPKYARGCPGYQLKAHTLFHAQQMFPHLRMIDSCACSDSFIEHVWAGRREITSTLFLTSRAASVACSVLGSLKWARDRSYQLFHTMSENHQADSQ